MPYYFYHWTPEIVAHLVANSVNQDDFEAIVAEPDSVEASRSSDRWIAFGVTEDGRELACVYDLIGDDVIPVTAYEPEH